MAKKLNEQVRKQHEVQMRAEQRREFMQRLQGLLDDLGGEGTFDLIPARELDLIYQFRVPAMKFVNSEEMHLPDVMVKRLNAAFRDIYQSMLILFLPDNRLIKVYDAVQVWFSMVVFVQRYEEKTDVWAVEFTKRIADFYTHNVRDRFFEQIEKFVVQLSCFWGNLYRDIIWVKLNIDTNFDRGRMQFTLQYFALRNEPKLIVGKQETRTAMPMYIPMDGICRHVQFRLKDIGKTTQFGDLKVEVYIMEHALKRLYERLDFFLPQLTRTMLVASLKEPSFHYEGDDKIFIALKYHRYLLGYLLAEYIDGLVLIRTFLFLTNNGTPEGKKLNELTGLSKEDKKYLQIDRLSAFMSGDLDQNERLMQLFSSVGCEDLFTLKRLIKDVEPNQLHSKHNADFVNNYLNLERVSVSDFAFSDVIDE